jgi:hypothetical protein
MERGRPRPLGKVAGARERQTVLEQAELLGDPFLQALDARA